MDESRSISLCAAHRSSNCPERNAVFACVNNSGTTLFSPDSTPSPPFIRLGMKYSSSPHSTEKSSRTSAAARTMARVCEAQSTVSFTPMNRGNRAASLAIRAASTSHPVRAGKL